MNVSVLVPTYRRPDDLARCLEAVAAQTAPAAEVVVVHRQDDLASIETLKRFETRLPLRPTVVREPGQVAALNAGLEAARGDLIAITDDDAAPRPDWLKRIAEHFQADPTLAGVGGRDHVYEDGRWIEGAQPVVGKVQYWGRCIGNHHLGSGPSREVDLLKGANMTYRAALLEGRRFDVRLAGAGAQVANDMAFALGLRRAGRRLVYDPRVAVDHFPAVRHDIDGRAVFSRQAQRNQVHNETLALLDFLSWPRRGLFLLWASLVGTRQAPGLALGLMALLARRRDAGDRLAATMTGRAGGIGTWLRTR